LRTQLLWQRVNSPPCANRSAVSPQAVSRIAESWPRIPLPGSHWGIHGCFGKAGVVMILLGRSSRSLQLFLGARTESALARASRSLKIEWDYSSAESSR
jgi:hypothetical protein